MELWQRFKGLAGSKRGPRGGEGVHGEGRSRKRGACGTNLAHTHTNVEHTRNTRKTTSQNKRGRHPTNVRTHLASLAPNSIHDRGGGGSRSIAASSGRYLLLEISRCTATAKLPTCSGRQFWAPQFCSMVTGELQCLLRSQDMCESGTRLASSRMLDLAFEVHAVIHTTPQMEM